MKKFMIVFVLVSGLFSYNLLARDRYQQPVQRPASKIVGATSGMVVVQQHLPQVPRSFMDHVALQEMLSDLLMKRKVQQLQEMLIHYIAASEQRDASFFFDMVKFIFDKAVAENIGAVVMMLLSAERMEVIAVMDTILQRSLDTYCESEEISEEMHVLLVRYRQQKRENAVKAAAAVAAFASFVQQHEALAKATGSGSGIIAGGSGSGDLLAVKK